MTYTPEQITAHIEHRAHCIGEDSKDVRILRQLLAACDAAWGEAVSAAAVMADKHYAAGDMGNPGHHILSLTKDNSHE